MKTLEFNSGGRVPVSNRDLAILTEGFLSYILKQGSTRLSGLHRPAHSLFMNNFQCCTCHGNFNGFIQ
jgi:hypothetical protein